MARLEALAREAAGPGIPEDAWDAVSLLPSLQPSGERSEPTKGQKGDCTLCPPLRVRSWWLSRGSASAVYASNLT